MGRTIRTRVIVLILGWLLGSNLLAQCETVPSFASFNVKDFGAKGDSQTDDTKAIQATLDAADKKALSEQLFPGWAYYVAHPVVFFPCGKYLVSDTIKLTRVNLTGEGTTIIYQTNKDKDIFASDYTWRLIVSGFTFVGGRTHLNLGNPNIDTGRILIKECGFYNSSGPALHFRKGSNSTQVNIRDCVFYYCDQALVTYCDLTSLEDSWITSARTMKNKAVIEARGWWLMMEDICGVPQPVPENDQRWIDLYEGCRVTCNRVRFGGEEAGFPAVVSFSHYAYTYPVISSGIVLNACRIYSAPNGNPKRPAAVFCEEIPNQIIIRECEIFGDLPVLKISDNVNLDTYFDKAKQRPDCLRFLIDADNVGGINRELPEQMKPYQADLKE